MAILADDDPDWRPNYYEYGRWGFHCGMTFPIVKLLDYASDVQALETNPNPFAVVVLAHLKTLETRHSPDQRYAWKVRLVKGLYDRGMDPEDVRQLFRFIDWIMELPEVPDRQFWQGITTYQEQRHMPFVTIAERVGREKGLEEGFLEGIELFLKQKFGREGLKLMPELRELHDYKRLRAVLRAIPTADSPEELSRVWKRHRANKQEQG